MCHNYGNDVQLLKYGEIFYNFDHFHVIEGSKLALSDIIPYTHLASPKTKNALEDFSRFVRTSESRPTNT